MTYKLNIKKPHLLCLILLISFPSVATVLISPALPAISAYFKLSHSYTQQLITIFIVGYALGQLLYSPFANRFGRKVAIYLGVSLYLLSSLICLAGIYLHNIEIILIGRFLMALGSSVGMIISFTLINDYYYPEHARAIVSYTVLAYAFMPGLAIVIGGLITSHLSWIGCFYFYFVYGIVILFAGIRVPETLQHRDTDAFKLKKLLQTYRHAFSTWRLVLFAIIYGLMSAFIYIIASRAPFIGINKIGLTPAYYSLFLLIPYCGQFIGAFSAGRFSKYLSIYPMIKIGYSSTLFGSLLMLLCFMTHWLNTFSLMVPMFFIMLGLPMIYSNVTVLALSNYTDKATGSAIMSFVTMSVTLAATFITTILPNKSLLIMPLAFIAILALATIALWHASHHFRT